jgi:hypothetical protein
MLKDLAVKLTFVYRLRRAGSVDTDSTVGWRCSDLLICESCAVVFEKVCWYRELNRVNESAALWKVHHVANFPDIRWCSDRAHCIQSAFRNLKSTTSHGQVAVTNSKKVHHNLVRAQAILHEHPNRLQRFNV